MRKIEFDYYAEAVVIADLLGPEFEEIAREIKKHDVPVGTAYGNSLEFWIDSQERRCVAKWGSR